MTGADWAVPYVPCGCGPGVLRTQACGDFKPPLRWWSLAKCAGCGHRDVPCHHVKLMEGMGFLLGNSWGEVEDPLKAFNDALLRDKLTWFTK